MDSASLPSSPLAASRPAALLKVAPEDFQVTELPAYEPAGEGEHLFLWIEKRDYPAEQLIRHVARSLDISPQDVGSAGLKDRRAITRQWLSVPAAYTNRVAAINIERVTVLEKRRHRNKLRTGHLKGNRFSILVRPAGSSEIAPQPFADEVWQQLQPALEQIRTQGFANFFGDQRFGRQGETLALGLDLLGRRRTPKDIPYARRRFLLKLALSSAQSQLFNEYLSERLREGLAATVLGGDVMEVAASGGVFVVEDAATEQTRLQAGETAITGPMFGPKMKQPLAEAAVREARILEQFGLKPTDFTGFGDLLPGTRRRLLIRPVDFSATPVPEGIRFEFELPAGAYATTLLESLFEFQQPASFRQPANPSESDPTEEAGSPD